MRYLDDEQGRIAQWAAVSAEFPPEAARWLDQFRDDPHMDSLSVDVGEDGNWRLEEELYAYSETLVFQDVRLQGDREFDVVWGAELSKTADGYLLELLTEYPSEHRDGDESVLAIAFSGLELERSFYDYTVLVSGRHCPWATVGHMLSAIAYKAEMLGDEVLNARERALLPLLEFENIFRFFGSSPHITAEGAELFARYARDAGQNALVTAAEALVGCATKRRADRQIKRLWSALEQKESEGVWRAIYSDLKAAAEEYPVRVAGSIKEESRLNERRAVSEALLSQGFEGTYPHFHRRSKLEGIHLRDANGVTQFAGFGRAMDSYIMCLERYGCNGSMTVSYVTSAIFPKKGEVSCGLDAFSGFFLDGNRRFGAVLDPNLPRWEGEKLIADCDNSEMALLAAKSAQLGKFSRYEWGKILGGVENASILGMLIALTLIGGVAFGAVMTVGMGLVSLLVGGLVVLLEGRDVSVLWDMMVSLPWLKLFLWTGGAFGVLMGGITAASQIRSLNR